MAGVAAVYDLCLTAAMALQGYGEVSGLYAQFVRFDELVHRRAAGRLVTHVG